MADKTKATAKKPQELYDLCSDTIGSYSERDSMLRRLEDYYFLELTKEEEAKAKKEGIEIVRGPHGTNVVDLVQDVLTGADITVDVPAVAETPTAKKYADQAERFLAAARKQSERRQRQSLMGQGAWNSAMRGALAGRVVVLESLWGKMVKGDHPKFEIGNELPISLQLRDPAVVYPQFGVDGLSYVVEEWTRTVQDVRQSLGPEALSGKKLTDQVKWREYWDESIYCYWANGTLVETRDGTGPWPHLYGGLPYSFEFARQTGKREPEKRVRPLLESMRLTVDRMDMLDSMELTGIAQYIGTAWVVHTAASKKIPIVTRPGYINQLEPEETIEPLQAGRQPVEMERSRARFQVMFERGTFPGTMFGEDPGRMVAGYAISLLNQSGQMRLGPIVDCMERFLSSMYGHVLMIAENYLRVVTDGKPIPFYEYTDAEEGGERFRARRQVEFDASKLGGHYHVEVKVGDLLPGDEQTNMSLATGARTPGPDGRPLLSWETTVRRYNLADSAADERDRIDRELAWDSPDVAALRAKLYTLKAIDELKEQLEDYGVDAEAYLAGLAGQQGAQGMAGGAEEGAIPPAGLVPPRAAQQPGQQMMQQPPTEQAPPGATQLAPGVYTALPAEVLQFLSENAPEALQALASGQATDEEIMLWLEQVMGQQQPAGPAMGGGQMAGPGGGMMPPGAPPGGMM